MNQRKYPPISIHRTLHGQLKVNWEEEYSNEFSCPRCQSRLTNFFSVKKSICQLGMGCKSCGKHICLTNPIPGTGRKHFPISIHQTLSNILEVDWREQYHNKFICPNCNQGQLEHFFYRKSSLCKLCLSCNVCRKQTNLTCPISIHINNYRPDLECPNPLCKKRGNDGQKGWIYNIKSGKNHCKCYFCQIVFNPVGNSPQSWIGSQKEVKLLSFCFDDNIWDLRHFYQQPSQRTINFHLLQPKWYQLQVKRYLHYLLQSRASSSKSTAGILITLRKFGEIIKQQKLQQPSNITRETILYFIDINQGIQNQTISCKLSHLKKFLEWMGLEVTHLVRSRDYPKKSKNDADWLDEVTRTSIKAHLRKIPAIIARHYLLQEYTAARPRDVCLMNFDCLVEEKGKWYVKFYQHKVDRWQRLPVTREIRQVIEEQQQWIRQAFGSDYSYLFCHFRGIQKIAYPAFLKIKPLPKPPLVDSTENPMVRIIRMLIEHEDIRDTNGQKPHFTGKITRHSRLQEVRVKYGMEAARLYADHRYSDTTFQHYAPPTREQVAKVDLPFQELLMNPDNKFLPWQSLPHSLLKNPKAHQLDLEIAPRLVVYGHCTLNPKTPCPVNLFPKCYGCSSFRPSTSKLPLYERQYQGEQERLTEAEKAGAELAQEEAKATIEAMDKWLPELRRLANGEA